MQQHTVAIALIVVLMLFKIYRHARHELGFQKFVKWRIFSKIVLMASFGVVLLVTGYSNPERYMFDGSGILLGYIFAWYSIRTSAFEWRNRDWFYRQNLWIGKCIFVLLAGRIVHKGYDDIWALFASEKLARQVPWAEYARDPSLTGVVFAFIAYYLVFYTFLIRKERQIKLTENV